MVKSGRRRRQRAEKSKVTLKQETAKSRKHKKKLQVKKGGFTEVKPVVQVASLNIGKSNQESNADKNEEVSFRKRPLQDWLRKLSNSMSSVRLEALKALRQLIKEDESAVITRFSDLLNKSIVLVTDFEQKIRAEAVRLVLDLLAKADEPLLLAFHRQLGAYLRCSLSHIDASVQSSGLDLLEGLIEVAPLILGLHAETLLQLDNLSNQGPSEVSKEMDVNKERKRNVFFRVNQKIDAIEREEKRKKELRLNECSVVEVKQLTASSDLMQQLYPRLRLDFPWVSREEVNNRVQKLMMEDRS